MLRALWPVAATCGTGITPGLKKAAGRGARRIECALLRGLRRDAAVAMSVLHEIEAVGVHHLGPGRDEVLDEFRLGVGRTVDLGECAQLRV